MDQTDRDIRHVLETVSDQSMPGFERRHIGGWVLRASLGATGRANSVWPRASPGVELSAALDETEAWYRARDLPCGFQLFDGHDPTLSEALRARSYVEVSGALVMWTPIDNITLGGADAKGWSLRVTAEIDPQLALLIDEPNRVREITMAQPEPTFAAALDSSGQLLAGGKSVLLAESLGIFTMVTAEHARRRGMASAILNHLVSTGRDGGAKWVWLQVAPNNKAAISLYERAGFKVAHSYTYRFPPR